MKLLGNNCLIEPLPVQFKTDAGIFLPQEQVGDKKMFWKVVQISPNASVPNGKKKRRPLDFGIGDTVITPLQFSHTTLEDGSGRKIIDASQVIARFENDLPTPDI